LTRRSLPTQLPKSTAKAKNAPSRSATKSAAGKKWPTKSAWRLFAQTRTAIRQRRLGVEPRKTGERGLLASQALKVLGHDSLAEFAAVTVPGKVIWCNFELAKQLGFSVPRSNQPTPKFYDQLVALLSLRSAAHESDVSGHAPISMYADRYGGDGLGPGLGAGRAGFLAKGNLYVKGVGFTPLFRHNNPNDFVHSHGGVHFEDCLTEAVFGEVNENLFTQGSSRILAIIDQGRYVTEPSGRERHIAVAVRAGSQLRPGHLLHRPGRPSQPLLVKFVAMTRATGQLVVRTNELTGDEIPDVAATMLQIIDDHARTGADGIRWRMIHGAISASNIEMSGAMLDLPTQSSQPRTAPVWTLDYAHSFFGEEHKERAFQLLPVYQKLLRRTPSAVRLQFNMKWLNIPHEMDRAYREHLKTRLLGATGLKKEVAEQLGLEHPELTERFVEVIVNMSRLRNPGSVSVSRALVETVSVLDVFHLLARFPARYFGNTAGNHTRAILAFLKPVYRGNRLHVAKKKATVAAFVKEFAGLYRELMTAAVDYAKNHYGSVPRMQRSIIARAAFENKPLDSLYYCSLYEQMNEAIAGYKTTGDAEIISKAIDRAIVTSLRSVDALLVQGDAQRLGECGVELQKRTIAGVDYSVRAWNDKKQTRKLHIGLQVTKRGKYFLVPTPGLKPLTRREIKAVRCRYTTDGWRSSSVVSGRLVGNERKGLSLEFEILTSPPLVGRLEGYCYSGKRASPPSSARRQGFGGYVFAIPDRQELLAAFLSQ